MLATRGLTTPPCGVPFIRGTILTVTTTIVILTLKIFDLIFVMTQGRNGTEVIADRMYKEMFTFSNQPRGAALAILLPLSFFVDPLVGIPFLLAVTKGGIFGGSIPAILVSIPGTGASMATTFDGPPLTKQGHSRKAMEIALFASAFGDTASSI